MQTVGFISYSIGAALFVLLSILLLSAWRGRFRGGLLAASCLMSAAWSVMLAFAAVREGINLKFLMGIEVGRSAIWFAFLLSVFSGALPQIRNRVRLAWVWILGLSGFLWVVLYAPHWLPPSWRSFVDTKVIYFSMMLLALTGLVLIEQLFRNTVQEQRWALKFLCLGVGAMFVYDFLLYAEAYLFNRTNMVLWVARGLVNAFVVPLIAVSAARNPQWSMEIFVSRHVVFHSATVLGAGSYLLVMSAAGYYIKSFGGTWGGFAQAVFMFGAVVFLLILIFSGQFRARLKLFLSKHFFKNQYDYRDEWLRFTRTLSAQPPDLTVRENVVKAIAEITASPGGVLWLRRGANTLEPIAHWNVPENELGEVDESSQFVRFLSSSGWIVSVDDYLAGDNTYEGLELPDWLLDYPQAWVVVPLIHHEDLLGLILLTRPHTTRKLTWEDTDLLKTVGRQAAGYLALLDANDALAESRQFEAFNRLSSFVVHDLKNLVAQLSLVGTNAKKHIDNPEFVADAIATVEKATEKMNRLLANLRKSDLDQTTSKMLNVAQVLRKVVKNRSVDNPIPTLTLKSKGLIVRADADRLASVLEHVVQNAQEATPQDGVVAVRADRHGDDIMIEVQDNGRGMDRAFIRDRLFKPFDTTKGNAGMGIGVYEAREFVLARGGSIDVKSEPGHGTIFRILLPSDPGLDYSEAEAELEVGN